MLIIAHRGIPKLAHENTIDSFLAALEFKPDMLELDVRKTRDGKLIVHHDETINGQSISDMDLKEVQEHYRPIGVTIAEFSEVVSLAKQHKIELDIELKEAGFELELMDFILEEMKADTFVVKSFKDEVVKCIKTTYPHIKAGLLLEETGVESRRGKPNTHFYFEERARACNADFLSPHYSLVREDFLERAHKMNLPVYIWTVNEEPLMKKYLQDDMVAAIITDHCDVAKRLQAQ